VPVSALGKTPTRGYATLILMTLIIASLEVQWLNVRLEIDGQYIDIMFIVFQHDDAFDEVIHSAGESVKRAGPVIAHKCVIASRCAAKQSPA